MRNLSISLVLCFVAGFVMHGQTVVPQKGTKGKYSFSVKNVYFEVDTSHGARVTSLKLNNKEVLYLANLSDMNGSTFWPSPQYPSPPNFGWPPIPEIDSMRYSLVIKDNKLILKGQLSSKYKIRAYKEFWADDADTSVTIVYYIKNENATAKSYAPWEVTRVVAKGLTFFAKGDTVVTGNMKDNAKESFGCYWYDQDKTTSSSAKNKFFCDGMGWLAHVNPDRQLFIKKFENISNSAPAKGESEVEVYTAPDHSYTELEDQGAYVSIPANDSIAWKVKWFARDLPAGMNVAIGGKELVKYAISVAKLPAVKDSNGVTSAKVSSIRKQGSFLFPNPANNEVKIDGLSAYDSKIITICNLQGAIVLKSVVNAGNSKLDVSNLKSGSYLYEIQTDSELSKKGVLLIAR